MSDFNGNKVNLCTGRELTVSDRLVELAMKSNAKMEYYSVNDAGARQLPLQTVYPNKELGFGALCARESLPV